MSVGRIVRHFDALSLVPVSLEDVISQLKVDVPDEIIKVTAVDAPFDELRGVMYRYKVDDQTTYMVPLHCSQIVYSGRLTLPWQRLTCCKELLHIVDPDPLVTASHAEVIRLAKQMARETPMNIDDANALQAFADEAGCWQAVACMFPYSLYESLLPRVKEGHLAVETIASWVQLPVGLTRVVMSDLWGQVRTTILAYA